MYHQESVHRTTETRAIYTSLQRIHQEQHPEQNRPKQGQRPSRALVHRQWTRAQECKHRLPILGKPSGAQGWKAKRPSRTKTPQPSNSSRPRASGWHTVGERLGPTRRSIRSAPCANQRATPVSCAGSDIQRGISRSTRCDRQKGPSHYRLPRRTRTPQPSNRPTPSWCSVG